MSEINSAGMMQLGYGYNSLRLKQPGGDPVTTTKPNTDYPGIDLQVEVTQGYFSNREDGFMRQRDMLKIMTVQGELLYGIGNADNMQKRFTFELGPNFYYDIQSEVDRIQRAVVGFGAVAKWEYLAIGRPEGGNYSGSNWAISAPLTLGIGKFNLMISEKAEPMLVFWDFKFQNELSLIYSLYSNFSKQLKRAEIYLSDIYRLGRINGADTLQGHLINMGVRASF